ncbi:MAG TPA: hypothetical protein VMZ04_03550 [Anaerolineae bacterium]|nr:hypothetical protein [Anaerolineae bacterium]
MNDIQKKYPNASRFLQNHPDLTVEQAIEYLEKREKIKIEKREIKHETKSKPTI